LFRISDLKTKPRNFKYLWLDLRSDRNITRYEQIYKAVRMVPAGKVATYGQIAKIVGGCTARMVGYAMAALPYGTDVPWQRIINYKGEISPRTRGDGALRQGKLLKAERVRFDRHRRINLKKFRWSTEKGNFREKA